MATFELVNRKRKPIKRYAFMGILLAILIIVLIAVTGRGLGNTLKIVLMGLVACTLIVCLFILNYSVKFKNTIGHISFSDKIIEIDILQKKEMIQLSDLKTIRFKLAGYEGLNNTTLIEYLIWFPSFFSYQSGMNNFVYIYTNSGTRTLEFYIRNRREWLNIKSLQKFYHERFTGNS